MITSEEIYKGDRENRGTIGVGRASPESESRPRESEFLVIIVAFPVAGKYPSTLICLHSISKKKKKKKKKTTVVS